MFSFNYCTGKNGREGAYRTGAIIEWRIDGHCGRTLLLYDIGVQTSVCTYFQLYLRDTKDEYHGLL